MEVQFDIINSVLKLNIWVLQQKKTYQQPGYPFPGFFIEKICKKKPGFYTRLNSVFSIVITKTRKF